MLAWYWYTVIVACDCVVNICAVCLQLQQLQHISHYLNGKNGKNINMEIKLITGGLCKKVN